MNSTRPTCIGIWNVGSVEFTALATSMTPGSKTHRRALVLITTTAIYGSDVHMYEGRTSAESGLVFGHENMGIVEEVGPGVASIRPGQRVSMPFNVACDFCKNCLRATPVSASR